MTRAASSARTGVEHELWYRPPATVWTEALPVGNGRLGAMVFGGYPVGRIQLNESSLWSGGLPEKFAAVAATSPAAKSLEFETKAGERWRIVAKP
jgi:alpha-L-fucosidase 2